MLKKFKSTHIKLRAARLSEIINYGPITEFDSFMETLNSPGDICTTIDPDGETPLHTSIKKNRKECLKKMLEFDININTRNSKGYTPLNYALLYGHINIASQFIEKGAQVDEICARKTGTTLLHKMTAINKPEAVRLLLENGASINKCDESGMTPLHMAAISGNKTLSILLEFGADVNQMNNFEQTALHLAIQMNQPEISKILINYGANLLMKDKAGKTILNLCASVGNSEICKQILKQTHVNLDTREKLLGRSPLHTACAIKSYPVVKLLLDYDANVKLLTRNRKAPIHIATEVGSTDILRILQEKSEMLERKTVQRKTPLILAVDEGHLQLVQYIINSKGNVNTKDLKGATPLHYAVKKGLLVFVKVFVENGADVNAKDKRLKTPLHEALIHGRDKIANYLLDMGADPHCLDDVQMSPFDYKTLLKIKFKRQRTYNKIKFVIDTWKDKTFASQTRNWSL